jgi:hypothetical protein
MGVYQDTDTNDTTWQIWTPVRVSNNGTLLNLLVDANGSSVFKLPNGDNFSVNLSSLPTIGFNYLFDGTNWDRERGDTEETILASAARTTAINSADFINYNAKGAHIIIDVSALIAGAELTPTIQGKDPVSGNYYDLLVGLPITATGTNIIKIYPGIAAVVNAAASDILPRTWRVSLAVANANSVTYSVGAQLVV